MAHQTLILGSHTLLASCTCDLIAVVFTFLWRISHSAQLDSSMTLFHPPADAQCPDKGYVTALHPSLLLVVLSD